MKSQLTSFQDFYNQIMKIVNILQNLTKSLNYSKFQKINFTTLVLKLRFNLHLNHNDITNVYQNQNYL